MAVKIIFVCNTYMQLITAVQIKTTLFSCDEADLILSDHSVNADRIAECALNSGIFKRVRYVQSKNFIYQYDQQGKINKIKDILSISLDLGRKYRQMFWDDMDYDDIFFFNPHYFFLSAIYRICMKNGTIPKVHCFEEGILNYKNMAPKPEGRKWKLLSNLFRCQGKPDFYERIEDCFCFYPELFPNKNMRCRKIPLLNRDDKRFIQIINKVFNYHPVCDTYPQRYVFFASSADIDGNPVGETELVLQIADLVGKENLLVKMHPRDGRDVYEKQEITVSRNSAIPWEVIQLNQDFSNHVFLTVSSGSVVNASAMLGDRIPTFFLHPLVKGRNAYIDDFCENTIQPILDGLKRIGTLQSVKTAYDLQDIVI